MKKKRLTARKIGFPVLVRPSYVLGGRAMEIVENEDDLRSYMRTAVKASQTTQSLLIAISLDVSVKWMPSLMVGCLDSGIMEHIERAGFTQGTQWQFTSQTL